MIPLILALDDPEYANRMAEWMLVHPECGFRPVVSEGDCAPLLHAVGMEPAILLISHTRPEWMELDAMGTPAIPLLEKQEFCPARFAGYGKSDAVPVGDALPGPSSAVIPARPSESRFPTDGVRKYQPLPDLFREIRALASERGWVVRNLEQSGRIPVTVVLHLSGATHMNPAAPALAVLQARRTGTLYLNLDPAGHTEAWFSATGGHGLSRLAYHVRNIRAGWDERFMNCLFLDPATGVHALREPDLPEDACSFGAKEVAELQCAAFRTGFGSIILDAGLGLDPRNLGLLAMADRILLVCGSDMPGLRKAASANRILNGTSPGRFREDAEIHWIICGASRIGERPVFPKSQVLHDLPEAYPDGFPSDGWTMKTEFVAGISRILMPQSERGQPAEVSG